MQIMADKTAGAMFIDNINAGIRWAKENLENLEGFDDDKISDGYHTFRELYEFRKIYNAALFNEWASEYWKIPITAASDPAKSIVLKYHVHKSWKHHDGEEPFPDSPHRWFIVVAMLPGGQISNHYKEEEWDLFKVPEVEKALFPFDGHTGADVLVRLKEIL
jgi:hypothetical protein